MTVKNLLSVYDNRTYVDVVIYDNNTDEMLALYKAEDRNHWYYGQLDCLTCLDTNPIEPYYNYTVKSFEVINTLDFNKMPTIYINI